MKKIMNLILSILVIVGITKIDSSFAQTPPGGGSGTSNVDIMILPHSTTGIYSENQDYNTSNKKEDDWDIWVKTYNGAKISSTGITFEITSTASTPVELVNANTPLVTNYIASASNGSNYNATSNELKISWAVPGAQETEYTAWTRVQTFYLNTNTTLNGGAITLKYKSAAYGNINGATFIDNSVYTFYSATPIAVNSDIIIPVNSTPTMTTVKIGSSTLTPDAAPVYDISISADITLKGEDLTDHYFSKAEIDFTSTGHDGLDKTVTFNSSNTMYANVDKIISLTDLSFNTTYYFNVKLYDNENQFVSKTNYSFKTLADNIPPSKVPGGYFTYMNDASATGNYNPTDVFGRIKFYQSTDNDGVAGYYAYRFSYLYGKGVVNDSGIISNSTTLAGMIANSNYLGTVSHSSSVTAGKANEMKINFDKLYRPELLELAGYTADNLAKERIVLIARDINGNFATQSVIMAKSGDCVGNNGSGKDLPDGVLNVFDAIEIYKTVTQTDIEYNAESPYYY